MTQADDETGTTDGPLERVLILTRRNEEDLAASFEVDLGPDLAVADYAAALLLTVLMRATPEVTTSEIQIAEDDSISGDIEGLDRHAQVFIGVRAWRAMRASRAVLAVGYEVESRALDRIIVELLAHRRAILEDPSGTEALAWIRGERGWRISQRVEKMTKDDLYKNMSHDSHGDPEAVRRLFDEESRSLILPPKRGAASRASLLLHAGFARDQAVLIAEMVGLEFDGDGLAVLDQEITRRWAALGFVGAAVPVAIGAWYGLIFVQVDRRGAGGRVRSNHRCTQARELATARDDTPLSIVPLVFGVHAAEVFGM